MKPDELRRTPRAEMPTEPAPVDSIPAVPAAGAVAPVVTVDYFGGTNWVVCDPDLAHAELLDGRLSKEAGYACLFERGGLEHRGSTATESLHLFEAVAR
nr:hypothetical protein asmbl_4 [uncultured bacterium]